MTDPGIDWDRMPYYGLREGWDGYWVPLLDGTWRKVRLPEFVAAVHEWQTRHGVETHAPEVTVSEAQK